MKRSTLPYAILSLLFAIYLSSCSEQSAIEENYEAPVELIQDQVLNTTLSAVRLGDGIPLELEVFLRWEITDPEGFSKQFATAGYYDSLILAPRSQQIAAKVSNTFKHVDSVFTTQREHYVTAVRQALIENGGEDYVNIKEVIISDVIFPLTYTSAQEQIALKERELERIRQQSVVDVEKAKAAEEKTVADGKVKIAKAEADGRVAEIDAKTEESRRKNTLARAETDAQVIQMKARAEANRQKLLAEADLDKRRKLDQQEVLKQRELDQVALEKQRQQDQLAMNMEMERATMYTENPVYASYLINKEMASKVQIAVLPTSTDAGVLGGMFQSSLTGNKRN